MDFAGIPLNTTDASSSYVKNGTIYPSASKNSVMVSSSSDLSGLTAHYGPGTIAYTAGFNNIWQLNAAGTWIEV